MMYKSDEERVDALLEVPQAIVAIVSDYPSGHHTRWHRHKRSQIVYAIKGVLTVSTEKGVWIVPPQRAVWVPANMQHRVEMSSDVAMRSLFIDPEVNTGLPERSIVLQVTPLLKELLLRFLEFPQPYNMQGAEGRLVQVMIDQLATLPTEPLHQPLTEEPRMKQILSAFYANPSDRSDLTYWADKLGVSIRTLARLFESEVGMSFTSCRQQIRLLAAVKRLAEGQSVSRVALDVGFQSQSSFTALFKRTFGVSPKQYFQIKKADNS